MITATSISTIVHNQEQWEEYKKQQQINFENLSCVAKKLLTKRGINP